jgi:putative molybdenum carrier protein
MTLKKVISGGQTGADIAGLKAARDVGIPTGGTAPKGYRTESGPRPKLLQALGLMESSSFHYPPRTAKNIADSDLTLIFTASTTLSGGSALTKDLCFKMQKPVFHVLVSDLEDRESYKDVRSWILRCEKHEIINIAGSRESTTPGIEDAVRKFLVKLFGGL